MFVVCGESLMDVFGTAPTATGYALDARIGGSPLNVALGLARLRQPVAFLSSISRDFLGDRLLQALHDEGVDTSTVVRSDKRTTLGLVGLDAQGVPSYAFYGENAADRELPADALAHLPAACVALHFGSYATVVEPVATTLRALVEQEKGRRLIAYDPNIRLNVEPELEVWRRHVRWMSARCDLLKISDEDLALLWPGQTPQAFAAQALADGTALVIVTRGGRGAVAWNAVDSVEIDGRAVELVDTVGAGDTFQAASLTWLAERGLLRAQALAQLDAAQLRQLLEFANAAAAITCSRRGADLPRRSELEA